MTELYTNNGTSTLATDLPIGATTATVQSGHGDRYPSPTATDFFRVVLFKKLTGEFEIAFCTSRTGDILTLTRAQEGTAELSLLANDLIEARPTAGFFSSLAVTSGSVQSGGYSYAQDTGAANQIVVALNPVYSAASYVIGMPVRVKVAVTNTSGTVTLNAGNPGTIQVRKNYNKVLAAGDLRAGGIYTLIFDGVYWQLQNPVGEFDSGTSMTFHQASAPIGWVQNTSHNDKYFRVVSGAGGGSGGTSPVSSAFNHTHGNTFTINGHAININEMPSHNHPGSVTTNLYYTNIVGAGLNLSGTPANAGVNGVTVAAQGGGQPHTHGLSGSVSTTNISPAYIDMIIASRN